MVPPAGQKHTYCGHIGGLEYSQDLESARLKIMCGGNKPLWTPFVSVEKLDKLFPDGRPQEIRVEVDIKMSTDGQAYDFLGMRILRPGGTRNSRSRARMHAQQRASLRENLRRPRPPLSDSLENVQRAFGQMTLARKPRRAQ